MLSSPGLFGPGPIVPSAFGSGHGPSVWGASFLILLILRGVLIGPDAFLSLWHSIGVRFDPSVLTR